MKNITTHFSNACNGFLYYHSGYPKYKNVKLVHPSDAGYQSYFQGYISASKSRRPIDYVAEQPSQLLRASRTVEHIVRNWYGSQPNRIIQYDVLYNGIYQRHYKECDIIKIDDDGTITIGEVKSSCKPSPGKAASQLQHSTEILSIVFPEINPVAITVDMASLYPSCNLEYPETTQHLNTTGLLFDSISLSLGDIVEFARENALTVNFDLLMNANKEAIKCVQKRTEKQHLRFLKNSQPDSPSTVTISAFGMLLQNALGHCSNHYQQF